MDLLKIFEQIAGVPIHPVVRLAIPTSIIYESEAYIVSASKDDESPCFEVLRRDVNPPTLAFLHGQSAQYFHGRIRTWQAVMPDQSEVEATLAELDWCNAFPLYQN